MNMYGTVDESLPGQKVGNEAVVDTCAAPAALDVAFGIPVFREEAEDVVAYPWVNDAPSVKFSADFVASNSIVATVAGSALAAVVFATDHATTFAALVAALEAVDGVTVTASSATARTISLSYLKAGAKTSLPLSFAITGGASQPTATVSAGTTRILGGVTLRTFGDIRDGAWQYGPTDPMNVLTRGVVAVKTADAVSSYNPVYITAAGAWTDEATGNYETTFTWKTSVSAAGMANVKVQGLSA